MKGAPPVDERPRCFNCDKPLKPIPLAGTRGQGTARPWSGRWEGAPRQWTSDKHPVPFFCTIRCACHLATFVAKGLVDGKALVLDNPVTEEKWKRGRS